MTTRWDSSSPIRKASDFAVGNYEHLKCYEARIGEWVLEGPILEDIPGIMEKGDEIVARISSNWVLNKNAIETTFTVKMKKSGLEYMSKGLTGWDARNHRILNGEMDCFAGHEVSIVTYDAATKTWTSTIDGCDGKGEEKSSTLVIKLKDKDFLEVQELNRRGGFAQGDSPKYIYKRVAK
ncbi:MAG: hypothetical protein ACYC0X_08535 [Pirellulaceae bacterium]